MTSNPHTPDEAELIGCYAHVLEDRAGEDYDKAKADAERGIEAIKTKARAEAWDDGYAKGALDDLLDRNQPTPNPYREQEASNE